MATGQRVPRWEKRCPIPQTHTRLRQLHQLWHRTADDYDRPSDFVTSLNAALVALRSVPEVLERGERQRVPEFDAWYAPRDAALRDDSLLRWVVKARNRVVHEGDLELHSRARVKVLVQGQEVPGIDIDVSPLLSPDEIALAIAPRLPAHVREQGVLAVERRWVADTLPDHELLDVLAHGYGKVAELVASAHLQCRVRMQTFGDEAHARRPQRREQLGGRLSCMVAHAALRTARVHLARNELMVAETHESKLTRESLADFDPGFEMPSEALVQEAGESVLDAGGRLALFARSVTEHQGFHAPMVMVFESLDLPPIITNLHASDAQEQVLMIETVVEQVERTRAEGIVFISEMDGSSHADGELLAVALTDDGRRRLWRTPLDRSPEGAVSLGQTTTQDGVVPDFLRPVERAWQAMGRGRPTSEARTD